MSVITAAGDVVGLLDSRGDVRRGDHQGVARGKRVDVLEGQAKVVFVNDGGRNFPVDYFFENNEKYDELNKGWYVTVTA